MEEEEEEEEERKKERNKLEGEKQELGKGQSVSQSVNKEGVEVL